MYRALIVEDEDLMRDYLAANLTNFCPEWETADIACDGAEALEKLQKENFDGVLTDIRMPVMDGLTATKEIRSIKRDDAAQIPIIAMTANAFEEDAKKCFAAGMNAHLAKPFQIDKVEKTLVQCIHKSI